MTNMSGITPKMIEQAAQVAQQANKAWCEVNGDFTQLDWPAAPDWQRLSAIDGARFHSENPDASDSASHDAWMAEKVAKGWVYGLEKDAEAKTHPCIVPFENLPKHQQIKDALFRATIHAILG